MKYALKYTLSPAGRKASLLAGGDGKRDQVILGETGDPDLLACPGVYVSDDGTVTTDPRSPTPSSPEEAAQHALDYRDKPLFALGDAVAVMKEAADDFIKKAEEKKASEAAKENETVRELAALPINECLREYGGKWELIWDLKYRKDNPELAVKYHDAKREAEARNEAAKKADDLRRVAKEAEALRAEKEKADYVARLMLWVENNCQGTARDRAKDGFMLVEEAEDLLRNLLFAELPLGGYERIKLSHVCDCDVDGSLRVETGELTHLSDEQYITLKATRNSLPNAVITPRYHYATASCCEQTLTRHSLRVEIEFLGRKFSREYAF